MKNILVLLLLFIGFVTSAQQFYYNTDSLLKELPNKVGREKVDLLNHITQSYRNKKTDSALLFGKQALNLARSLDYKKGELLANGQIGQVFTVKGKYDSVIFYSNQSLTDPDLKNTPQVAAMSYNLMGSANWSLGRYDASIEFYQKAIKTAEASGNWSDVGSGLAGIGYVYQTMNKLPQAEEYLKKALDAFAKTTNIVGRLSAMHALANVYGMQGKFKEALKIDEDGLALSNSMGITTTISMFYDNMANCYLYSGQYNLAYDYFNRCIPLDREKDNYKQLSDTYTNLGNLFVMQQKFQNSIPYLDTALVYANEAGYRQGKYYTLSLLSDAYRNIGNLEKAYSYLQQMQLVKDSVRSESSENKIAELEALYQVEKKEQELLLQKIKVSKRNYAIWGISVAALLLILLSVAFYRKKLLEKETKMQANISAEQKAAAQAVIEAEERERKRIAGDLHDGIGQMMSAVKMNLSSLRAKIPLQNEYDISLMEKTLHLVDESCKEVRTVSHNMMPNALLRNGLASAVKEFLDKIDHHQLQVNLYTEGLNQRLPGNIETVLYRIIQEVVNNVIKHAQANSLDISLIKDVQAVACTIEDNGRGFDVAAIPSFTGIGLKNIQTRIDYLKGTVEWSSAPEKGTLVAIHVPLVN
jgi:two-component system, NarL family, sensor kinase